MFLALLVLLVPSPLSVSYHWNTTTYVQQARLKFEMEERITEKSKLAKDIWAKAEEQLLEHRKIREAHEEEVANLKREFHKKSALAREMISDKETMVNTLTARVEELESEIATGGHSERKIMELAGIYGWVARAV